jgi:ribonuclease D
MSHYTHEYIDSTADFAAYRRSLRSREILSIAIDIEGEFNLHIYGEHFCLLQVFDGERVVLVDPFSVEIAEIQELLEDRDIAKLTYDAASDRALLFKNHRIRMRGIVDLRPAVELLSYEKKGLSSVIESALGVPPSSGKKRFQQYNWMKRPIDAGAIEYAISDVLHLYDLRDLLFRRLWEERLFEPYIRENLKVQDLDPETDREPGILRSGAFRRLSRSRQRLFRDLYEIRDRYARELNVPPNTAFPNKRLFAVLQDPRLLNDTRPARNVSRVKFTAMVEEMYGTIADGDTT